MARLARQLRRRPVRLGLVAAALVVGALALVSLASLRDLHEEVLAQTALMRTLPAVPSDERIRVLSDDLHILTDVRRLKTALGLGLMTALAVLVSGFHLAARGSAMETVVERQRAMVAGSKDAIFLLDPDTVIREMNPAAEALFGYPAEEMVGHRFTDFNPPEVRAFAEASFRASLQLGSSTNEGIHVVRKDGSVAIADFDVLVVNSDPPMVISIGHDMTASRTAAEELVQSQEQLRQAQKMEAIGLLAGGVAHDFNNALTVINGYVELILDAMPTGDPNRPRIEEIGRAGTRASDITRQLLAFSRRQRSQFRTLDLNATVRDTASMLRRLVGEDVVLTTRLDPGIGKIMADSGHVQQVLMNLAVNARDAMPGGGRLTIETAMTGGRTGSVTAASFVRLMVSDTGCGMDEATQRRVFEPFFTTKAVGKGTGLGLSIVFGIVRDSGGIISIKSSPGRGATFIVDLPEVTAEAPMEGVPEAAVERSATHGTILFVEDDPQLATFTQLSLSLHGYRVLNAEDGDRALARARAHEGPIDLVITDLVMPGLPVEEMIAGLKAARPRIKVLCVSGYPDRARLHPLLTRGEMPYLEKPFSSATLLSAVARELEAPVRELAGSVA